MTSRDGDRSGGLFDRLTRTGSDGEIPYRGISPDYVTGLEPDPRFSRSPGAVEYSTRDKRDLWVKCAHGYLLKEAVCPTCAVPKGDPQACGWCGMPTVRKSGRYGAFTACSAYPSCKWTVDKEAFESTRQAFEKYRKNQERARIDKERQDRLNEDVLRTIVELQKRMDRKAVKPSRPSAPPPPNVIPKPQTEIESRFANLDFDDD